MANPSTEPRAPTRDERASRPGSLAPAGEDLVGDDLPRPLGRYMLLKRIARGGMGEVLLASTMGIEGAERPVIVKIIRREHKKDPNFHARFLDETRVQAQLSHSGVAQVLEAAIDDLTGEPYAIVEHVEGKSLGELRHRAVQTGHRIGWADAVALTQLIAEGLAHVHERRDASGRPLAIVHRDLSPQNVMVSFTGEVKIIDFGTARGQNRRCHTVAGVVFAKPGYVAPEVANGDSGDARVDLYALGVMLWELCAGRRFLQGDAQAHLARVARNELDPPAIAAQIGAPEGLDTAIARLTAFDRDARYLAARPAATDLAKLLSAAPALPSGERGVRQRASHLMHALFAGEPLATRKEFARLVAAARSRKAAPAPAPAAKPQAPNVEPRRAEAPKIAAAKIDAPELARGTGLEGAPYRAIREIGRGASSVVHEVEHTATKKRAALKVLAGEGATSPSAVERFRRGARALSLLSHEHLVRVLDVGTLADGRPYAVMDLCDGETLKDHLAREKGADYREALGLSSKILAALEVAHAAGVVHRDIQPSNVFLTSDGGLKVLDFGLAGGRAISLDAAAQGPARDVVIYGTPEYMAPEQVAGGEVDGRADLYSVGCVLFEMLTGKLPFEGPGAVALLDQKRKGSPPKPAEVAPERGIPEVVSEVVMKALARHPGARFQSATEMRKAIDAALAGGPRSNRSRRVARAFAAITAMMVIALGAGLVKSEGLRARLPASVAAIFVKSAPPIVAEAPPADLATVPLGEIPLDAPAANGAPVAANDAPATNDAPAANDDPALEDPSEHDDVLAAAEGIDEAAAPPPAQIDDAPAPEPAKATPKPHHRARPGAKKPASKKPPKAAEAVPSLPAGKPQKTDAAHPSKDPAPKELAPSKDDDEAARRKKKKKVRVAKAR